jgi:hypothetical protein
MDEKYLIRAFYANLEYYRDSLNEIKKELGKIVAYGAGNSFLPGILQEKNSWILNSLILLKK